MRLTSQQATHIGRQRISNEDNLMASDAVGLYAIADGAGGRPAGEIASALFVDAVKAAEPEFEALYRATAGRLDQSRDRIIKFVDEVFQRASKAVYAHTHQEDARPGTASTGVLLALLDGCAVIGHVGDSRAYLLRAGRLRQLTTDHTVAAEMIAAGALDPSNVSSFQFRNVLSRSLGTLPNTRIDTLWLDAAAGDRFILCTDGFYRYFDGDAMVGVCNRSVEEGVAAGVAAGGADDLSAIFVDIKGTPTRVFAIDMDHRIRALSAMFLFRELTPQEILTTLKIVREQQVEPGLPLVREGALGDRMYLVVDGQLDVVKHGVKLAELGPGDHFGEISFMDARPRSASVVARTEAKVLTLQRDDFMRLTQDDSGLANKLLRSLVMTLSERLRHLDEDFVKGR